MLYDSQLGHHLLPDYLVYQRVLASIIHVMDLDLSRIIRIDDPILPMVLLLSLLILHEIKIRLMDLNLFFQILPDMPILLTAIDLHILILPDFRILLIDLEHCIQI